MLSGILGGTIYDELQIFVEIFTLVLLVYTVIKKKIHQSDIILLSVLILVSLISLFLNPFTAFLLNFKLFSLSILTFINFKNTKFYPSKLIHYALGINIFLIIFQFYSGRFIIPSGFFLSYYRGYTNDRPLGLFLTPHASSFFIYVYLIFLLYSNKSIKYKIFIFVSGLLTQSYTSFISFIFQFISFLTKSTYFFNRVFSKNFIFILLIISIISLYFFVDDFILYLETFGGVTRYYSAKIILDQLFEPEYYKVIYKNFYPIRYSDYFEISGDNIESLASEVGLIKVVVEGGSILGFLTLFLFLKRIKLYRIFIIVSLMHYTHIISTPFFLYLMLYYNNQIHFKKS